MRRKKEVEALRAQVAALQAQLSAAKPPKQKPPSEKSPPAPPVMPHGYAVGIDFSASTLEEAGVIAARFFAGTR